jgi:hypothetical protein
MATSNPVVFRVLMVMKAFGYIEIPLLMGRDMHPGAVVEFPGVVRDAPTQSGKAVGFTAGKSGDPESIGSEPPPKDTEKPKI